MFLSVISINCNNELMTWLWWLIAYSRCFHVLKLYIVAEVLMFQCVVTVIYWNVYTCLVHDFVLTYLKWEVNSVCSSSCQLERCTKHALGGERGEQRCNLLCALLWKTLSWEQEYTCICIYVPLGNHFSFWREWLI
jgi:hypothetical protein